jgi:FeS assembly SUF system protein
MADELKQQVIEALRTCYDPEIPVNIYDLGLIYELDVSDAGAVSLRMTLTAPNCPVAGSLPAEVERRVRAVAGVTDAKIELVWDPPWDKSKLSPAALIQLGMY